MFCMKCGNNVPDGSKFCPGCGSPIQENEWKTVVEEAESKGIVEEPVVEEPETKEIVEEPVVEEAESKEINRKGRKKIFLGIGISVAAVLCIVAIILSQGNSLFTEQVSKEESLAKQNTSSKDEKQSSKKQNDSDEAKKKSSEKKTDKKETSKKSAEEEDDKESASKEETGKEESAKEKTTKEQAAKDAAAKEKAAKEKAAKEQAAKDAAAKEQAAKIQAAKDAAEKKAAEEKAAAEAEAKAQAEIYQVAQQQVSDWTVAFYEQYNQNDAINSVRSSFVSGTSDETIYTVLSKLNTLSGRENVGIDIIKNDDSEIVARIYGYDGDDKLKCSGGCFGFSKIDGTIVYSSEIYDQAACETCGGSGQVVAASTTCSICGGSGQQYIPNALYDNIMGWQGVWQSCSGCGGSGQISTYSNCTDCRGWGVRQ